jgi:valyl-tRNA synthetase
VSAVTALRLALDAMLRLLAPVLCFATEEVWSWRHEGSIHLAPWPTVAELALPDNTVPAALTVASAALVELRRAKTDRQLPQRAPVISATLEGPATLGAISEDLCQVAAIETLVLVEGDSIKLTEFEPGSLEDDR